jgi:hypothetical protein
MGKEFGEIVLKTLSGFAILGFMELAARRREVFCMTPDNAVDELDRHRIEQNFYFGQFNCSVSQHRLYHDRHVLSPAIYPKVINHLRDRWSLAFELGSLYSIYPMFILTLESVTVQQSAVVQTLTSKAFIMMGCVSAPGMIADTAYAEVTASIPYRYMFRRLHGLRSPLVLFQYPDT